MYAGTVVEQGTTTRAMTQPYHPYTRALFDCLRQGKKAAQLQTIPGAVPDLIDPPPGCRFHPRCRHAMPVCSEVKPQPTALTDDHWASCHFVAQGLEAGRAS